MDGKSNKGIKSIGIKLSLDAKRFLKEILFIFREILIQNIQKKASIFLYVCGSELDN